MHCLKCNKPIFKDNLCNIHYYKRKWLNNSDINDLRIVHFAKSVVPEWVRNDTADFQKEVLYHFFQMYSTKNINKYDRLLAEIAFRGAAKTTWAKIILLYICCFGLEKFVVYCSETNKFAVQDVFEVRKELKSNVRIRVYFGIISSREVQGLEGEWSKDAFLAMKDGKPSTYVLARGVGQQVRSALRNSYRPTLAIVNDMYSKDSVKTEYGRAEYAKWFFNDMFNAVDDLDGKVFFNGTILHEDTVPVTIENNPQWKVLKYPVMDIDDFHKAVALCKVNEDTVILPSDAILGELHVKLTWESRLNMKYILTKYAEAYQSNQVDGFYQEYFHMVVAPGDKPFRMVHRVSMDYFRSGKQNWLKVNFGDREVVYPVNVYFGVDPASSTTAAAKYSVIIVVMMNQHRQIFFYSYSRGRYGLRDELLERRGDSDIVELDRKNIRRPGIVDEEIRLAKFFIPKGSQIETTQAQEHIYTEIGRLMRINNALHPIYSEKPQQKKEERDADMLSPYFQTGSAFINFGLDEFELELKHFPRGGTVDIIDAAYHAVCIAKPAENISFEEQSKNRRKKDELEHSFHALV